MDVSRLLPASAGPLFQEVVPPASAPAVQSLPLPAGAPYRVYDPSAQLGFWHATGPFHNPTWRSTTGSLVVAAPDGRPITVPFEVVSPEYHETSLICKDLGNEDIFRAFTQLLHQAFPDIHLKCDIQTSEWMLSKLGWKGRIESLKHFLGSHGIADWACERYGSFRGESRSMELTLTPESIVVRVGSFASPEISMRWNSFLDALTQKITV